MSVSTYKKHKGRHAEDAKTSLTRQAQTPQSVSGSDLLQTSGVGAPRPMSAALREKFEPGFFADFSNIRISRGHIPEEYGLKGVSRGNDILLDHSADDAVLGHELAHVVQRAMGRVPQGGYPVVENAALEHEADVQGARVASGASTSMEGMQGASIAPMSGAQASALPAQCKKDKDKKKDVTHAPGEMTFGTRTSRGLKANPAGGHSVFSMGAANRDSAILKAGANPQAESALADYLNVGGEAFGRRGGSSWSFDAPAARALTPAEQPQVRAMMEGNRLGGQSMGSQSFSAASPSQQQAALANTTVFTRATGKSRAEPGSEAAAKPGAYVENPSNPQEASDYRRMIGYTGALDMAIGNGDRTYGMINLANWMEDRGTRQMHLIDQVEETERGAVRGRAGRTEWLRDLFQRTQEVDDRGRATGRHSMQGYGQQKLSQVANDQEMLRMNPTDAAAGSYRVSGMLFGSETGTGAQQALQDMPQMRAELAARYRAQNPTGDGFTEMQQEVLDRMNIMTEAMNPAMQGIYKQLAEIGMEAKPDDKPAVASRRAALYAQLEAKRQEAAYGGQTRGPIDRSRIPGHGSYADWLPPGSTPASRAPLPRPKRKSADAHTICLFHPASSLVGGASYLVYSLTKLLTLSHFFGREVR